MYPSVENIFFKLINQFQNNNNNNKSSPKKRQYSKSLVQYSMMSKRRKSMLNTRTNKQEKIFYMAYLDKVSFTDEEIIISFNIAYSFERPPNFKVLSTTLALTSLYSSSTPEKPPF